MIQSASCQQLPNSRWPWLGGSLEIGLRRALHVREERLSARHDACRLLYVSDIHLRNGRSETLCRQVLEAVAGCNPDVVLLGGDLVDCSSELDRLGELVAGLHEVASVLAIGGNHDQRIGTDRVRDTVEHAGGQWIHDGTARLTHGERVIAVSGPDTTAPVDGHVRVLCAHNPRIWKTLHHGGYDLVLAGHLHGCQILDTGVRVLRQRDWEERERRIYRRLRGTSIGVQADGVLVLPLLPGHTLARWLEDPALEESLRKTAIERAVVALAEFHHLGFTHADAMAENVLVDLEAGAAYWFDFETIHDSSRPLAWRRADDVRALLVTCLVRTTPEKRVETLEFILNVYADEDITRVLPTSFTSVWPPRSLSTSFRRDCLFSVSVTSASGCETAHENRDLETVVSAGRQSDREDRDRLSPAIRPPNQRRDRTPYREPGRGARRRLARANRR